MPRARNAKTNAELDQRVTIAEANQFYGTNLSTIKAWRNGDPAFPKDGSDRLYSLRAIGVYLIGKKMDERTNAEIRLRNSQALKNEIQIEQMRGELVEAALVGQAWNEFIGRCVASLTQIPSAIAPLIASMDDPQECQVLLRDRVKESLQKLSEDSNLIDEILEGIGV